MQDSTRKPAPRQTVPLFLRDVIVPQSELPAIVPTKKHACDRCRFCKRVHLLCCQSVTICGGSYPRNIASKGKGMV